MDCKPQVGVTIVLDPILFLLVHHMGIFKNNSTINVTMITPTSSLQIFYHFVEY